MASLKKSLAFLVVVIACVLVELKPITGQTTPTHNDVHVCLRCNGTANSSNLASLLDSFTAGASLNNSSYKNSSSGIYGLFLYRGEVLSSSCIENATWILPDWCPFTPAALIWFEQCMLRYSDTNFFGVMSTYSTLFVYSVQNNSSPEEPDVDALALMYNLLENVPYIAMMYGVQESSIGNGSQRRYGLAQCTRDINSTQCRSCLSQLS